MCVNKVSRCLSVFSFVWVCVWGECVCVKKCVGVGMGVFFLFVCFVLVFVLFYFVLFFVLFLLLKV